MKSYVFQPVVLCVLLGVCSCAEPITDERLAREVIETAFPSWSQLSHGERRSEAVEDCAKQADALDNLRGDRAAAQNIDQYGSSAAERRWAEECEQRYSCDPFNVQRYVNPHFDSQYWEDAKRTHVYYRTLFGMMVNSCHLDIVPSDVTICNRRSEGDTIYYDASLRRFVKTRQLNSYACSFIRKDGDGFGSCVLQQNRTNVCPEQSRLID